jgi:hypothetical protein
MGFVDMQALACRESVRKSYLFADFDLVSLSKSNAGSITLPTSNDTTSASFLQNHMTRLRHEILQTKAQLWDEGSATSTLEEFVVSIVDQFTTSPYLDLTTTCCRTIIIIIVLKKVLSKSYPPVARILSIANLLYEDGCNISTNYC